VNYLDTAPNYGNPETGFAEEKMGPAIHKLWDKVFLVSKTEEHTYDFEHKVWSRAQSLNVGLVAMKVLGGAVNQEAGFRVNEKHYEQAIRYALSVPGIAVAVIGLENITELEKRRLGRRQRPAPFAPGKPGAGAGRARAVSHTGVASPLRHAAGVIEGDCDCAASKLDRRCARELETNVREFANPEVRS
jgi:hypothetical protein